MSALDSQKVSGEPGQKLLEAMACIAPHDCVADVSRTAAAALLLLLLLAACAACLDAELATAAEASVRWLMAEQRP